VSMKSVQTLPTVNGSISVPECCEHSRGEFMGKSINQFKIDRKWPGRGHRRAGAPLAQYEMRR
jgi:hypothetical protein